RIDDGFPVLACGVAEAMRESQTLHQRPELILDGDVGQREESRLHLVALVVVRWLRRAGAVLVASLEGARRRPGWTGDASGRIALLPRFDDAVSTTRLLCPDEPVAGPVRAEAPQKEYRPDRHQKHPQQPAFLLICHMCPSVYGLGSRRVSAGR